MVKRQIWWVNFYLSFKLDDERLISSIFLTNLR